MDLTATVQKLFDDFSPENLRASASYSMEKQKYNFRIFASQITINGVEYKNLDCSNDPHWSRIAASRWHNNKFHALSPAAHKKLLAIFDHWRYSRIKDENLLSQLRQEAYKELVEKQEQLVVELKEKLEEAEKELQNLKRGLGPK